MFYRVMMLISLIVLPGLGVAGDLQTSHSVQGTVIAELVFCHINSFAFM
jgi:hypothetical protein